MDIFVRALCVAVTDEFHESRVFLECKTKRKYIWNVEQVQMRAFGSKISDKVEDNGHIASVVDVIIFFLQKLFYYLVLL